MGESTCAAMTLDSHKQGLLAGDNEQQTAFMAEAPDKRALEKARRVELETQALDDISMGRSEETRQHRWDKQRGRSESRGKASYQRSVPRERGTRSSSRSQSRNGFGRDNSR